MKIGRLNDKNDPFLCYYTIVNESPHGKIVDLNGPRGGPIYWVLGALTPADLEKAPIGRMAHTSVRNKPLPLPLPPK